MLFHFTMVYVRIVGLLPNIIFDIFIRIIKNYKDFRMTKILEGENNGQNLITTKKQY